LIKILEYSIKIPKILMKNERFCREDEEILSENEEICGMNDPMFMNIGLEGNRNEWESKPAAPKSGEVTKEWQ